MSPEGLSTAGVVLMIAGGFGIIIPGVFFAQYMQNAVAAGLGGTTTNPATSLSLLNSAENSPWMVTLSFFGLAFLIIGGVFVAIASLRGQLLETIEQAQAQSIPQQIPAMQVQQQQRPSRACTKCGTLVVIDTAFCPNCGNPLSRVQPMVPA